MATHMTARERARQAAAYASDPESTTSTVSSIHASDTEFEVEAIYAEETFEENDIEVCKYLVKWKNYPKHRCEWLPKCNLGDDTFAKWQKDRRHLTRRDFDQRIAEVQEAWQLADEKQRLRYQKRDKMRRQNKALHSASRTASATASTIIRRRKSPAAQSSSSSKPSSDDEQATDEQAPSDVTNKPKLLRKPSLSRKPSTGMSLTKAPDKERRFPAAVAPPSEQQRRRSTTDGEAASDVTAMPATHGPIRIINEPKQKPRVWNTEGKIFSTLKFRHKAEVRGRMEGTPDPNALEFVNATPSNPIQANGRANQSDHLYARREPGARRAEDSREHDDTPLSSYELRSYERGKVPLACWDFIYQTCHFTHERCRFLHRQKDQYGKDLKVCPASMQVPAKYRIPPETCWFWLRGLTGCGKSDEECEYAHENTGTLHVLDNDTNRSPIEKIDRTELPVYDPTTAISSKTWNGTKPISATCWFWLKGPQGCKNSASECRYAHYNNGLLLDPGKPGHPPGPISLDEKPSARAPLGLTCFYWNEGTCIRSEATCSFLHRYTGQVANPPRKWKIPPGWVQKIRDEPTEDPMRSWQGERIIADEPRRGVSLEYSGTVGPDSLSSEDARNCTTTVADSSEPISGNYVRFENDYISSEEDSNNQATMKSAVEGRHATTEPAITTGDLKRRIEVALKLDFEAMFKINQSQNDDEICDRRAFLMFNPREHVEDYQLIQRWLLINFVEIFTIVYHGAWDAFKQCILDGGSGVIIAHPEFESFAEVPDFGEVLRRDVRLWSVGMQETAQFSIWDSSSSQELHYGRFEIFPHGGIIYITDSVFIDKPQLALKIVELFFSKIEASRKVEGPVIPGMYIDDGLLVWRLGVRPELMKWIGDKCMERTAEIAAGDPDDVSREQLYHLLYHSGYIEPESARDQPFDNRPIDFFPIISECEAFAERIGLYYRALEQSQYEADTQMVDHFSSLVILERRKYRHFFVVHTEPDKVDWKLRITNINEVLTPETCIEYFEAEPRGSMFDNYEWAYEKKSSADK